MKKIPILLLISTAFVACKKETATVTKIDPETGKITTVEVPKDSVKEIAEIPAIKDSAGVFKQIFKLEKGKTYPLVTLQKDSRTITLPDGTSQSGTNESTDDMSFTINEFKNGVYDISINIIGKKISQSADGKTIVVDTKTAAPQEEDLKMIWNVNKSLVGNKLQMKMKENGEVLSITGFEPIYKKVLAAVESTLTAEQKATFPEYFKSSFNQEIIKDQFMKNLKLIPEKGVKIGEKWTQSENASADGSVKITTTYVLKSVGNGSVEIEISGGIPKKSDKQTQQGVTRTVSSELSQNGTIILDQNTGWVKKQNISVKTAQTETYSDGTQFQTMKSVSNSSVIIN
ncbi:MAG: DUF6263 family protein [Flavobacteriaceae bacterium]|jgi:hypothetical protein|nr:DUF6263 family protein [Flavobacteriaceae bacterium]